MSQPALSHSLWSPQVIAMAGTADRHAPEQLIDFAGIRSCGYICLLPRANCSPHMQPAQSNLVTGTLADLPRGRSQLLADV